MTEPSQVEVPTYTLPKIAPPTEKVKYITNKELLAEIHKSKLTYCAYDKNKPEHAAYDTIVAQLADITPELVETTRARKAYLRTQSEKKELRAASAKQSELKAVDFPPSSIPIDTIIFRVMTSQHIPLDPDRKRKGKGENGNHTRTPFLPFKHYYINTNGDLEENIDLVAKLGKEYEFVECLRSHWEGTIADGEFNMIRGTMTHRLAVMYMMLVDRYSRRTNWRGYTYLDEMKSHALLQLSQIGLQFNEAVSDNPFAFYTTTIKNCFTRVLNLEKRNQNIRDDILIMNGANPSYTRQNDEEHARAMRGHAAGGFDEVVHTVSEGYELPEIESDEELGDAADDVLDDASFSEDDSDMISFDVDD
jgi:hypothetical protein